MIGAPASSKSWIWGATLKDKPVTSRSVWLDLSWIFGPLETPDTLGAILRKDLNFVVKYADLTYHVLLIRVVDSTIKDNEQLS